MSINYFKEAIKAIETAQEKLNSTTKNSIKEIDENLSYALNCLNEVDYIYGIMEEEENEQFDNKFSNN